MNSTLESTSTTESPIVKGKVPKFSLLLFLGISATALFAFTVPFRWELVGLAVLSYYFRMFGITAAYHRYFSHNSFKTSRVFQFILAYIGATAMQKGPLWWGAHHRNHHRYSDTEKDIHSPRQKGFWYAHMLWFLKDDYNDFDSRMIKDYYKFPELVFLNKYHWLAPLSYASVLYIVGGWDWLVYGFAVSTFFLGHGTWTINSLAHVIGSRRFDTKDDSRNNLFLSIITMGEGWHNNHHHYAHSANQGFYWYEIDMSYYILKVMSWFGLVWDLKKPPIKVLDEGKRLDALKQGKLRFRSLENGNWIPTELKPELLNAVARES